MKAIMASNVPSELTLAVLLVVAYSAGACSVNPNPSQRDETLNPKPNPIKFRV